MIRVRKHHYKPSFIYGKKNQNCTVQTFPIFTDISFVIQGGVKLILTHSPCVYSYSNVALYIIFFYSLVKVALMIRFQSGGE